MAAPDENGWRRLMRMSGGDGEKTQAIGPVRIQTASNMLMFILPAVARTGLSGLTVFYVPLHLPPQSTAASYILPKK